MFHTITPLTTNALAAPAAALFRRVLEAIQDFEELGGSADYAADMGDVADAAKAWQEPADRIGTNALDDVRHWLQVGREVLSAQDSDALQAAVVAEALGRVEVYRTTDDATA